jgi:transposase
MILPSNGLSVFAFQQPVDMRKQHDSLAALVPDSLRQALLDGALFLFIGRDRKRAKVLWFDGTGVCVLFKRLGKNRFAMLWGDDSSSRNLSATELSLFLEGSSLVGRVALTPPAIDRAKDCFVDARRFAVDE